MPTKTDEKSGTKCVVAELAVEQDDHTVTSHRNLTGATEHHRFAGQDLSMLDLIELLLKNQRQLDGLSQTSVAQRKLVPRLLAIGLIGYTVFGVTLSLFFAAAKVWPELTATAQWLDDPRQALIDFAPRPEATVWQYWLDGSALQLTTAFTLGMIGAIGICLPSFYFYGLLAEGNCRAAQCEQARRDNFVRLREVRGRAYADLTATLASVRELVSMIHLAKFTGAPASRADELVTQIAAAVEGLSEVATWHDAATIREGQPSVLVTDQQLSPLSAAGRS